MEIFLLDGTTGQYFVTGPLRVSPEHILPFQIMKNFASISDTELDISVAALHSYSMK